VFLRRSEPIPAPAARHSCRTRPETKIQAPWERHKIPRQAAKPPSRQQPFGNFRNFLCALASWREVRWFRCRFPKIPAPPARLPLNFIFDNHL
jgi:hypothetical protein